MSFYTVRDGQLLELTTPYDKFKDFKKFFNGIVSDGFSAVYQRMPAEMTIVSKMRFEFDESPGFNVIDNDAMGRLAFVHQEVISQITGTMSAAELICFVMNHAQAEVNGTYVEEVYFQFPFIKSTSEFMATRLVTGLKHFFTQTQLHNDHMEVIPSNTLDEMISGDIYKYGLWPMPGSYINNNILTFSNIFERITSEQLREGKFVNYPPEAYFNNYQVPDNSDYDLSSAFFFANLEGFDIVKKKKTQREKNRDVSSRMIEERQKEVRRSPLELCRIFVGMLSTQRYKGEISRNKVGQVLFNVMKGSEDGLELWKDSIRSKLEAMNNGLPDAYAEAGRLGISVDQYLMTREQFPDRQALLRASDDELQETIEIINSACNELWQYFEYTDSTIGTLKFWAKMDNPEQYAAFMQKDVITLAWRCLNPTAGHTDAAKLCYAKYSDMVTCANIRDNSWYGYWQNRWHELDKCHRLRTLISDELPPLFERILDECMTEYRRAIGDEDKEKWAKLSRAASDMIKKLKDVPYKNHLITECCERFYDPDFFQKLDEDRTLIGCPNGVYELETGLFRPGKPEDFITLSTKAKYNEHYNWDHPRVKAVVYYMKTVYPDVNLRHYVQKAFGTILEGGNMNKDFYNMVGEGDNSKSMIAKLLKLALGKYISKIPVSMIMGKRGNADNATPHLADKKGVRALFVEEPPKGQSNVSVVKELSGNDDILSRALFKMPIIFSPQWKLFVFTNHMLEAPADEKAYWNRQKVVDHESTFSFDAPASEAEQFAKKVFPRDPFFDRKLLDMAEPFFWCLIQWYGHFKKEGLIPPDRVLHATNQAKLRNDIYLQYIKAALEQGTQHDTIDVMALYTDFRDWHQKGFGGRAFPNLQEFEDEMSKQGHLGTKTVDHMWRGIKLKGKVTQLPTFGPGPQLAGNQQQNHPLPNFNLPNQQPLIFAQ